MARQSLKNKNNLLNGVVKDYSIKPNDITSIFNSMAESEALNQEISPMA